MVLGRLFPFHFFKECPCFFFFFSGAGNSSGVLFIFTIPFHQKDCLTLRVVPFVLMKQILMFILYFVK